MKHLLVTNDFPPKIGGIQNLLWEWWRRLPPDPFAVLTSPYAGTSEFDAEQAYRIERVREFALLPHPVMVKRVNDLAADFGAELVVLDPAVPLGLIGPSLDLPYDVVLHGAEVTIPGRLPGTRQALAHVLRNARHVIAAGQYSLDEANRDLDALRDVAADAGVAGAAVLLPPTPNPIGAIHARQMGPAPNGLFMDDNLALTVLQGNRC